MFCVECGKYLCEYIDAYYNELKNDYYSSVIYKDLEQIEDTLEFVPNEKYKQLDLTDLEESPNIIFIIAISAIGVIAVAAIIVVLIVKGNLKKKNLSYKEKRHGRKA